MPLKAGGVDERKRERFLSSFVCVGLMLSILLLVLFLSAPES